MFREILELDQFIDTPVRSLSLGQRMRADLCAAFLHNPTLVFLDEPTIGLDVVAKQRIRDFIQFINKERKTTILLTTHDISDIAKLCERVLIIDHGKILFDGKLAALLAEFGGHRLLSVEFAETYPNPALEDAQNHPIGRPARCLQLRAKKGLSIQIDQSPFHCLPDFRSGSTGPTHRGYDPPDL